MSEPSFPLRPVHSVPPTHPEPLILGPAPRKPRLWSAVGPAAACAGVLGIYVAAMSYLFRPEPPAQAAQPPAPLATASGSEPGPEVRVMGVSQEWASPGSPATLETAPPAAPAPVRGLEQVRADLENARGQLEEAEKRIRILESDRLAKPAIPPIRAALPARESALTAPVPVVAASRLGSEAPRAAQPAASSVTSAPVTKTAPVAPSTAPEPVPAPPGRAPEAKPAAKPAASAQPEGPAEADPGYLPTERRAGEFR